MTDRTVTLRLLVSADIPTFAAWLDKDFIRKWYGDPEEWLAEIKNESGEFDWLHHYIVEHEGAPIGFCQYYHCADTPKGFEWDNEPPGTFAIDYLIGDEAYLKKGYGSAIIMALCALIVSNHKPGFFVADPVPENEDSIRLLLKNGFTLDEATGMYKRPA